MVYSQTMIESDYLSNRFGGISTVENKKYLPGFHKKISDGDTDYSVVIDSKTPQSKVAVGIQTSFSYNNQNTFGVIAAIRDDLVDLTLNHILSFKEHSQFQLQSSVNFLYGKKKIDFDSGQDNIRAQQFGYALNPTYTSSKSTKLGFSMWGISAKQVNTLDEKYFLVEDATQYLIMKDDRSVALGSTSGYSADVSALLLPQLNAKLSLGRDKLEFHEFSRVQTLRKMFITTGLDYCFFSNTISVSHTNNSYGGTSSISMATQGWNISLSRYTFDFDERTNYRAMIVYKSNFERRGAKEVNKCSMPYSEFRGIDQLKSEAKVRPQVFPTDFLLRKDTSKSPTTVGSIMKSALPQGASVNQSGQINLNVGAGIQTINFVERNGVVIQFSSLFQNNSGLLIIDLKKFPNVVSGVDRYVINVTDINGGNYAVDLVVQ